MNDAPQPPTADEYRERDERARVDARARYRDHLAVVLSARGVEQATELAEVTVDALTEWRYVDTGERCRCSCHPSLPSSDRHDYGFDCTCTHTPEQRRESFRGALNEIREYWQSPEAKQNKAANQAAEAELQNWLTRDPGVVVHSHGGWAPEQWQGEVDGHSFYFRERHDDWYIEIDIRPTGRFVNAIVGRDDDGTTRHRQKEVRQGDVIASGTIAVDDYGATVVERAQFIVTTIRDHLRRKACTHHPDKHGSVSAVLGTAVLWCPDCGTRLPAK
ncbi:hypothetical protein [Mycolicibacterium sp. P9-64]|uniref:hypothetical protein n=1 Tax=Mycolicibacterium sp. P9-64 TaxID=2024612 RepID=UPI001F5B6F25|nr:hypothetical protein [Mycolicibacterium sp. P9-64]